MVYAFSRSLPFARSPTVVLQCMTFALLTVLPAAFVNRMTLYTFRPDAPSFGFDQPPRMQAMKPSEDNQEIANLRIRIAALSGPENRMKRRRLRQRLEKLEGNIFLEAKAALQTVVLPSISESIGSSPSAPAKPATRPVESTPASQSRRPRRPRSPQRGTVPNIAWRAVTMEELRAHPSFVALPPAATVVPTSAVDLRLFRQDSRQWWAIHAGRISTSACASCLGVYEEKSARSLRVPPSLCGHGKALDAHARLCSPALEDFALLHPDEWADSDDVPTNATQAAAVWQLPRTTGLDTSPFLYEHVGMHAKGRGSRSGGTGGALRAATYRSVGQIRMAWGSVQEATSILAALNYFGQRNATVEEAGLQPLEALPHAERARLPSPLPPIGASPDAIVRWPDGTVEPFEAPSSDGTRWATDEP